MWRPYFWELDKPIGFATKDIKKDKTGWVKLVNDPKMLALYELGADDMLEALRNSPNTMSKDVAALNGFCATYPGAWQNGKWVFIPDDTQEGEK